MGRAILINGKYSFYSNLKKHLNKCVECIPKHLSKDAKKLYDLQVKNILIANELEILKTPK